MMGPLNWLRSNQLDYGIGAAIFGLLIMVLGLHWMGITQSTVFSWLFALAPIWLPFTTFLIFFWKYMDMVGKLFYLDSGRVTYEVKLPQEVYKSPEAMEAVLSLLFNKATPDNLMETYLQGKRPQVFSFEIVSNGGEVKFYVNLPIKKGEPMLEPSFYAQYPGIELRRLDLDYTAEVPIAQPEHFTMSFHMCKQKDYYPIKTYVDVKLQDLPKEEEKVDPLTTLVEFMSSIKPTEKVWIQFLCTAHRERSFANGQLRFKDTWNKGVHKEIDKLMQRDKESSGPTDFDGLPRITPGERQTIEAMERNVEKPAFEMVSRWIYMCQPGEGRGDIFAGMLRSFAAFDVADRNKISITWRTDFDYKFISDPFGTRLNALRKQELKEYKLRKLFPKISSTNIRVFSTEEIATLWHPLGTVALTPTLDRVTSIKSEAPPNLPVSR